MTKNILEAVNIVREFFGIEDYPGDFFSRLEKVDYTKEYRLLLFKEDIDKLSGFIGYGVDDLAVICINYKRTYGHQNFTLAHELGHLFLHKGVSISDDDHALGYSGDKVEKEANEFASELLYPEEFLVKDHFFAIQQDFGTMGIKIIRLVKLEEIPGAKAELKKIRKRFYDWMKDPNYLRHLIEQGKISNDDIKKKSFRNKDMGECELIAIATVSSDEYQIVTNDKGRVFLHPEQNLFNEYASELGLVQYLLNRWTISFRYDIMYPDYSGGHFHGKNCY